VVQAARLHEAGNDRETTFQQRHSVGLCRRAACTTQALHNPYRPRDPHFFAAKLGKPVKLIAKCRLENA
jgi:hypothetical protein